MKTVIHRREFLRGGMAAAGTLVLGGMGTIGCAGTRRPDVTSQSRFNRPISPDLEKMLYLASFAPSSHNVQPWQVQLINESTLHLRIDPMRTLPVVDAQSREMYLSLGAFIENFSLAANSMGHGISVSVAESRSLRPLCTISLERGTSSSQVKATTKATAAAIEHRRTVRRGLSGGADVIARCRQLAETVSETRFFPMNGNTASRLGQITLDANIRQTADDAAQKELAGWIRFKNRDAEQKRDGLTTESMEITGIAGWVVRTFMDRDSVMGEKFRKQGIAQVRSTVTEGAGWFVMESASDSIADCIDAGRRFERLALTCVPHGLSVHPMSQALEYNDTRQKVKHVVGISGTPQFLLRVGQIPGKRTPVSLRRPVSDFTAFGS